MSKTCNATSLLHIRQALDQQSQRQENDVLVIQRQIEGIKLQQVKLGENVVEANENIGDLRSWQTNMGQKLVNGQLQPPVSCNKSVQINTLTFLFNNKSNKILLDCTPFIFDPPDLLPHRETTWQT